MSINHTQVLALQDLAVGASWESFSRTITQTEISLFAGLSGDFNPIHVDHELARLGPFGQPVAHGLLGLAIASGLGSFAPRVDTIAFLEVVFWKFQKPIFIGDTIRVVTRVDDVQHRSRGRRGVVTWHRQIKNQRSEVVQEGQTRTLVQGRLAGPESTVELKDP